MPIDFHDAVNRNTYASRQTDSSWFDQMHTVLGERPLGTVADIGCGGGIYSRAWRELGATSVIGLDSSAQMVEDAWKSTDDETLRFEVASAYETGLDDASCDVVFSRAVVHHLDDLAGALVEMHRILKPDGLIIVQDRTIEDVDQPISPQHLRAHFFSEYPRLLESERRRRPETEAFLIRMSDAGFDQPVVMTFWETRRVYRTPHELKDDLLGRTGRSILHELSDDELATLTEVILDASRGHFPLEERDRWTMWTATKSTVGA